MFQTGVSQTVFLLLGIGFLGERFSFFFFGGGEKGGRVRAGGGGGSVAGAARMSAGRMGGS